MVFRLIYRHMYSLFTLGEFHEIRLRCFSSYLYLIPSLLYAFKKVVLG